MITARLLTPRKYFIVTYGCGKQFQVKYGKIETEVGDFCDLRPIGEFNKIYRIPKKDVYDTLDEAEHRAKSQIEANAVTARSVLESSVQLLKFN